MRLSFFKYNDKYFVCDREKKTCYQIVFEEGEPKLVEDKSAFAKLKATEEVLVEVKRTTTELEREMEERMERIRKEMRELEEKIESALSSFV